jgi:hypothetical protein
MQTRIPCWAVPVMFALGSACESVSVNDPPDPPGQDTAMVALSTLGDDTYLGLKAGSIRWAPMISRWTTPRPAPLPHV